MSIEDTSKQLKLLQDELACLRAAETHVQEKIDVLLDDLNSQLNHEHQQEEPQDLGDLPQNAAKIRN